MAEEVSAPGLPPSHEPVVSVSYEEEGSPLSVSEPSPVAAEDSSVPSAPAVVEQEIYLSDDESSALPGPDDSHLSGDVEQDASLPEETQSWPSPIDNKNRSDVEESIAPQQ
jgi:hypothetical protein